MRDQVKPAIEDENIPEKMRSLETEFTVGRAPDGWHNGPNWQSHEC